MEIVKLLLPNGADPCVKDEIGKTPLHVAAESGHTNVVWLPLAEGVDVDVKDNKENTPLQLAKQTYKSYRRDVIRFLRRHAAEE